MLRDTLCLLFMLSVAVARAEDIEWDREELIVDPSRVEGKAAHQKQQITQVVGIRQHLLGVFAPHHPQGCSQDHTPVPDVSEHDSEEEGEDGDCEKSRIYLLVTRHTVGIDNFLERRSERVHFEVSRWFLVSLWLADGDNTREQLEQKSSLLLSYPNFGDERVVSLLQQVQGVEDGGLPFKQNAVSFKFRIPVIFI